MNRVTRALTDTALKMLFRASQVTEVSDLGPRFRTIELAGDELRNTSWSPGDKIQVWAAPDGFTVRTYTPLSWDPVRGSTRLLAYLHGDGPGSAWFSTVTVGDPCRFFGPRRGLELDDLVGPVLFVGDETSFALAAAWCRRYAHRSPAVAVFEVDDPDESAHALEAIGVPSARLIRRSDRQGHLDELATAVVDLLRTHPDVPLCLTGRARSIAVVRRRIRSAGLADRPKRVKAHWDEKRTGLD